MEGSRPIYATFVIGLVALLFASSAYAFSTSTSSITVSLEPGKFAQQTISVTLNNETLLATRSGDKAAWIAFSQSFFNYTGNSGTESISVIITVPPNTSPGTYHAKIILKNETSSKEIPVTIQVQQPQQPWYSLQLPNNGWLEKGQSFLLDGVKITLYDVGQLACFLKLEGCTDLYKKVDYGSSETIACNGHKINISAITYFIPSQGNPLVQFEMKSDYAFSASITPTQPPEQEQTSQTPLLKRLNVAVMPGFACPGQLVTIEVTDDTGRHVNAEGRITTSSGRSEQISIIGGFYDFIIPRDATYVIVRVFAEGYEPTAKVFEIDPTCRVTPHPPEQNQTQQTQQEQEQENQQSQQCMLTLVINNTRVKTTEKVVATVFEDGDPSQGARVCFTSQTSQRCYLTNAQGRVEVSLPAGNYTAKAEKVNCQASNQIHVEVYEESQPQQQTQNQTQQQQQQIQRMKVILAPFINETRVNFTDLKPGDRVLFKLLTENGTVAKVDATLTIIHGNFTANITVTDGVAEQHVVLQDTGNYAIKVTGSSIEPVFKEFEIHELAPAAASGGISGKTILALITIIVIILLVIRFRKKKIKPKPKGSKKAGFGVVSEKSPLSKMSKEEVEEELEEIS